jgi:hypothetical protein
MRAHGAVEPRMFVHVLEKRTRARPAIYAETGPAASAPSMQFGRRHMKGTSLMHSIDPNSLPETKGTLERFLFNQHGELDGMLLREGHEVHFPPHMGVAVEALARPGQVVKVRGVKPRNADVLDAVRIENGGGEGVTDEGPPEGDDKHRREKARHAAAGKREKCSTEGDIVRLLHGPNGETRGALLDGGTILRWPPHEGERVAASLRVGSFVAARGDAVTTKFGKVVEVRALGPSADKMRELGPKPKGGHHGPRPHDKHPSRHE